MLVIDGEIAKNFEYNLKVTLPPQVDPDSI